MARKLGDLCMRGARRPEPEEQPLPSDDLACHPLQCIKSLLPVIERVDRTLGCPWCNPATRESALTECQSLLSMMDQAIRQMYEQLRAGLYTPLADPP